jgi:hypothetical protein
MTFVKGDKLCYASTRVISFLESSSESEGPSPPPSRIASANDRPKYLGGGWHPDYQRLAFSWFYFILYLSSDACNFHSCDADKTRGGLVTSPLTDRPEVASKVSQPEADAEPGDCREKTQPEASSRLGRGFVESAAVPSAAEGIISPAAKLTDCSFSDWKM